MSQSEPKATTPFAGDADANRIRKNLCDLAATNVSPVQKWGSDQLDLKNGIIPPPPYVLNVELKRATWPCLDYHVCYA
jgi:hypothetical protein